MKFIHCADIHLDSAMESNLSPAQARQRNTELCRSFSRMVEYALQQEVTAILIAGDLFDSKRISAATAGYLLDRISAAPNIPFLYIKGNHDEAERAFAGHNLPKNLITFTDSWSYHSFGSVTVAGIELSEDSCTTLYDTLALDPDCLNIVMLHGQAASRPAADQIALPLLRGKHIDYLALGHLHSYRAARLDERGICCYSGCLEGRGFDECGEKGFVLLETDGNRLQHRFVPFAHRRLYHIPTDITGCTTTPQILDLLRTASAHIPDTALVKFTLQGTYTPDTHKDLHFLQTMLSDRFFFVKITDESHLQLEPADYENDISLKGEFMRMVLVSDLPDSDKDRIITAGLAALRGEEVGL